MRHKILRTGFGVIWTVASALAVCQMMTDSADQTADPTGWIFGGYTIVALVGMVIFAYLDKTGLSKP